MQTSQGGWSFLMSKIKKKTKKISALSVILLKIGSFNIYTI